MREGGEGKKFGGSRERKIKWRLSTFNQFALVKKKDEKKNLVNDSINGDLVNLRCSPFSIKMRLRERRKPLKVHCRGTTVVAVRIWERIFIKKLESQLYMLHSRILIIALFFLCSSSATSLFPSSSFIHASIYFWKKCVCVCTSRENQSMAVYSLFRKI